MKLYSYFRSSAAYRVRIALNLKGLAYETVPLNLLQGEEKSADYRAMNPQALVPALEEDGGAVLSQSMAIMEWLEECYPERPLLPEEPLARARVRSLANHISCDIHPILNVSVLNYLRDSLAADGDQVKAWYRHWIERGFTAIEAALSGGAGPFCWGGEPTLADCCLVPQVFNARRFEVPMDAYPGIVSVVEHCSELEPFLAAHPARQPDSRD